MRELFDVAWYRFNVITGVVADSNARFISLLFYFTILVPFAIGSIIFTDPLRKKVGASGQPVGLGWMEREPIAEDVDAARQQG